MDNNVCNVNHLDSDVLLPPRKRLLAGLKKQSSDVDATSCPSLISSSCPVVCAAASSSSPSSSEFDTRLKNLLKSHKDSQNLSPEQIVEASKSAAMAAAKAAEAARTAAQEKAAKASKAIAAAKSALDLVASFSEEAASKERYLKKNKLKKQLPVQLLYKKYQSIENHTEDEELARKLHRAMNSSPRIIKNPSNSDSKSHKHKRPKDSPSNEITGLSNGGMVVQQDCLSPCNGHVVTDKVDSEGSIQEVYSSKEDKVPGRYDNSSQMEIDDGEAESSQSKEKTGEDVPFFMGKKRGRVKLKKLPLSICTFKDKSHSKDEMNTRSSPLTEMNAGDNQSGGMPLFPVETSSDNIMPIEATPQWKCQEFKAPTCIKQNKVAQS